MNKLNELNPQPLFSYFEKICQVPRPSKKEDKIRNFLVDFAQTNNLRSKVDDAGNLLIFKAAFPGKENVTPVILQTHMDMVCEKNSDKAFDFNNDPIEPMVTDGWIRANGTTLGADCGIGIAAQLAILTSNTVKHGPIECLITVDEETGLTGAFALKPDFLTGSILLNLDSEDEGEVFIGCAGGIDTLATFSFKNERVNPDSCSFRISVTGLTGGHSGDDIHKNRGNAIKILTRFLWQANREFNLQISKVDGGNLRNAIAREASAIVVVPHKQINKLLTVLKKFADDFSFEFENNEPMLNIKYEQIELPEFVMDKSSQDKLLNTLYACPHGVLEMSTRMKGMVETSTNLASVKFEKGNKIIITTSQRSELESRKKYAANMVHAVFEMAGGKVSHSGGYPGWTPNPDSRILKITVDSYQRLFGKKPLVRSIHAGLECGLFLEKYPHLEMVSFGPTIKGAHSPDERLNIETTQKFWNHLVDVLEHIE